MAQISAGVRAILGSPMVYDVLQSIVGASRMRRELVERHLRPWTDAAFLDIGCGTGAILDHMPAIHYLGLDTSDGYVAAAQARYGTRATFIACDAVEAIKRIDTRFDLILASGLLHHLDDTPAVELFAHARRLLAPRGRLVTVDGCWQAGQSMVARFLLSHDRGQNVRDVDGYRRLARTSFEDVQAEIRDDILRVPFTLCFLDCQA
jgi:SAM-dependent methyltransferase